MLQGIGASHGCGIGRALVAAARAAEFTLRTVATRPLSGRGWRRQRRPSRRIINAPAAQVRLNWASRRARSS